MSSLIFNIQPVVHTHIMHKLFGPANEIDSHSKPRHPDLALGKYWDTQCCWLQLCTTVYMEFF